jgi:hypothetical protein
LFDVEHVIFTGPDDPKIREITTRMSRFVCNLETGYERCTEKAYIVETKAPIVFSRHTPDKVTAEKNVYLITKLEKNGSRVFLAPGVIAVIVFINKRFDQSSAEEAQLFFLNYFARQIKGAGVDGNDLLINGKKVMGMTVIFNEPNGTAMIRFMLTVKSESVIKMTDDEDFADRKYKTITGVCDETGMSEGAIRALVSGFPETVLLWGMGNAAK